MGDGQGYEFIYLFTCGAKLPKRPRHCGVWASCVGQNLAAEGARCSHSSPTSKPPIC